MRIAVLINTHVLDYRGTVSPLRGRIYLNYPRSITNKKGWMAQMVDHTYRYYLFQDLPMLVMPADGYCPTCATARWRFHTTAQTAPWYTKIYWRLWGTPR